MQIDQDKIQDEQLIDNVADRLKAIYELKRAMDDGESFDQAVARAVDYGMVDPDNLDATETLFDLFEVYIEGDATSDSLEKINWYPDAQSLISDFTESWRQDVEHKDLYYAKGTDSRVDFLRAQAIGLDKMLNVSVEEQGKHVIKSNSTTRERGKSKGFTPEI